MMGVLKSFIKQRFTNKPQPNQPKQPTSEEANPSCYTQQQQESKSLSHNTHLQPTIYDNYAHIIVIHNAS
jgi:hypothetical protein